MAARKSNTTASTDEFKSFLLELNKLTEKYLGNAAVQKAAEEVATSDEDEDEAGAEASSEYTEAELKKLTVAKLRKIAIDEGFDEGEVNEASKSDLIEGILGDDEDEEDDSEDEEDADTEEDEEEGEDDEDEDEEEEDDEDEEIREELEGMTLAKLRKAARDDYGATGAELKGLDKDAIIDLILNAGEEDDSDVDIDEEDEEAEDGYTEDELKAMELDDLKEILDEWEVEYGPKARKATLVKLVLEVQEEEEYEDYEEE